ncbi:hypothetical protein EVG20_g45 [Dentipellis fragilis]|uniref:Uncharacterized protein n=1 Tax=Dentipellis fragilis TaxID=205917 RepID=A0A4Y9ZFN5_9AGAM|nr:hypothetical protein EVG20_g45 [Dentipellis fragilis]
MDAYFQVVILQVGRHPRSTSNFRLIAQKSSSWRSFLSGRGSEEVACFAKTIKFKLRNGPNGKLHSAAPAETNSASSASNGSSDHGAEDKCRYNMTKREFSRRDSPVCLPLRAYMRTSQLFVPPSDRRQQNKKQNTALEPRVKPRYVAWAGYRDRSGLADARRANKVGFALINRHDKETSRP